MLNFLEIIKRECHGKLLAVTIKNENNTLTNEFVAGTLQQIKCFYKEIKSKKYHFNSNWPLIACLFIIIIMLIYIILSRPIFKKKKKRANELEDEFEYVPKNYEKIGDINKLGI